MKIAQSESEPQQIAGLKVPIVGAQSSSRNLPPSGMGLKEGSFGGSFGPLQIGAGASELRQISGNAWGPQLGPFHGGDTVTFAVFDGDDQPAIFDRVCPAGAAIGGGRAEPDEPESYRYQFTVDGTATKRISGHSLNRGWFRFGNGAAVPLRL